MNKSETLIDFLKQEWLLVLSATALLISSIYIHSPPEYSSKELRVLFVLFVLLVSLNGLVRSGLLEKISLSMAPQTFLPARLVALTFFLSMFLTNDVALLVTIPLTLSLNIHRKGDLVILETLAANAGSALTPFGNPQNLFLYWFYDLTPISFLRAIAPLSLSFLVLLLIASLSLKIDPIPEKESGNKLRHPLRAFFYTVIFFLNVLVSLKILPLWIGGGSLVAMFLFDKRALRVDYALLLTFLFFFGFANNLRTILKGSLAHAGHTFILSALASQLIGNVPAALLFARFVTHWKALLWGVNVGGFGSIFGSFANLIACRIYLTGNNTEKTLPFLRRFLVAGYAAFFLGIVLYFIMT